MLAGSNPVIPLSVLRKAEAPRATPERELEWAGTMYASLVASAPEVWLSHPRQEGGRELRPSPFLESLPGVESAPVARAPGDDLLEHFPDDQGPALEPGQKTRGGIGVIDTQARNPLWAFVKYRLGARALTDYAGIYDQNSRGLFLHRAVELVWRMLKDQDALKDARVGGRLGGIGRERGRERV